MSDPAFQVRIRADKSGPEPVRNERGEYVHPWPAAGLEIIGDPPKHVGFSTAFVRRNVALGFIRTEGSRIVERPSRPEPGVKGGSTVVTDAHRLPAPDMPNPHVFEHLGRIILITLNHGEVVYSVDRQPDKYATNTKGVVTDDQAKVTAELYAEGRTSVLTDYVCTLVSKES